MRLYWPSVNRVFGQSLEDAWQDWIAFERGFQEANLEAVRKFPITPHMDLSPQALGSVSRAHVDTENRVIYAALNYPGIVGHIGAISLSVAFVSCHARRVVVCLCGAKTWIR